MKYRLPLYLFAILLCSACGSDGPERQITDAIDHVKATYAPDKREERLEVSHEVDGDHHILSGYTTSVEAKNALINTMDSLGIAYRESIIVYPDSTIGPYKHGVVSASVAHLRSEPRHSAELSTQETMGHVVELFTRQGDWYLARTPNRYISWINAHAILPMTDAQLSAWQRTSKLIVQSPLGWIKAAPRHEAAVLSDYVAGMLVEDKGSAPGGYRRIGLPDGRVGYLDAKVADSPMSQDSILSHARAYLGLPYLWGGTSAKGFDCSGYTKSIFELHGLILPRDASQQARVGKEIKTDKSWSSLRPGDLLFFGSKRDDGSHRVTHVAIYLGDGQIIHAAGQVKIESLTPGTDGFSKHRYDTFLSARRMLGPDGKRAGVKAFEL